MKGCVKMASNNLNNMMDTTMDNIRQMVDVNTIIGEPIVCPDGTVIVPVSKVSYGFAAGGSDLPPKTNTQKEFFAGGSGAGVSIQPVAFLVVNTGPVNMLNMEFDGAVDRVISMVPDIADKIGDLIKKKNKKKDKSSQEDEYEYAEPVTAKRTVKKTEPKIKVKKPKQPVEVAYEENIDEVYEEAAQVD